jgi:glycosyltransferase involved in cell wall biosynthesis
MKQEPKLRIAYLSGSVDAVAVHRAWTSGRPLGYFGASAITDFFHLCADWGAEGYVITTLDGEYRSQKMGDFVIENRPLPSGTKGAFYHIVNAIWLLRMIPSIVRFRPNIFVITAGRNYWFLLTILPWIGIKIIPSCPCTFWPKFAPVRKSWRILLRLNAIFLSHFVVGVITMSEDIARQVRSLLGGKKVPMAVFLPVYSPGQFESFTPVAFSTRPFRVFFAGRIETTKGIYDLVTIADRLNRQKPQAFHFDICGGGSELQALQRKILKLGLQEVITCHGYCERSQLSQVLQGSHVVIVPTTTQFEEGFNMVCAESILAGRPVVTSAVCPALEYIKDAAIEVPPDDVMAYCRALLDLSNDRDLYERKLTACKPLQAQFYDIHNGWGAKLREIAAPHLPVQISQR